MTGDSGRILPRLHPLPRRPDHPAAVPAAPVTWPQEPQERKGSVSEPPGWAGTLLPEVPELHIPAWKAPG